MRKWIIISIFGLAAMGGIFLRGEVKACCIPNTWDTLLPLIQNEAGTPVETPTALPATPTPTPIPTATPNPDWTEPQYFYQEDGAWGWGGYHFLYPIPEGVPAEQCLNPVFVDGDVAGWHFDADRIYSDQLISYSGKLFWDIVYDWDFLMDNLNEFDPNSFKEFKVKFYCS